MLGAIAGDIIGSVYEFNNIKTKDFPLFDEECFPTDDSVMTLAIAKALTEWKKGGDLEQLTIRYMHQIGMQYPDCGYGGHFGRWILLNDTEPYFSFGNGAAMRVSPVAYVARDLEEVKTLSRIVTGVTHNHPEGIKGAEATAVASWMALHGSSKEEIGDYVRENYYDLKFTLDEIRPYYTFDVTCQGSVPQAIQCFLESENYEDCIRNCISIGGDSDTIAAIAGAIAGTYYGIPEDIAMVADSYLDETLRGVLTEFEEAFYINER